MLQENLVALGLSDKEIKVYIALLETKYMSAAELAHKTKIHRSTVYAVLEELRRKKLIDSDSSKKIEKFLPMPAENLGSLFAREERELVRKKELARKTALEVAQYGAAAVFSIPKSTFVSEEDMDEYLYTHTSKWVTSMQQYDSTLWGFTTPSYSKVLHEYVHWWSKKHEGKVELKLFTSSTDEQLNINRQYRNRQMKIWPGQQQFTTSVTVQGDYLVMQHTEKRPYYIVDICDKVLTENIRNMFQTMWKVV